MRYSNERREAILKKLLPPHSRTVAEVADEEGISAATLYNWRKAARGQGRLLPEQAAGGDALAQRGHAQVFEFPALDQTHHGSGGRRTHFAYPACAMCHVSISGIWRVI